eukprot:CFRG1632T1
MSGRTALVIIADGQEELESVAAIDILRRGKVDVTVSGLESGDPIACSRGVVIVPDASLSTATAKCPYDMIVLPGGLGGAKANASSAVVKGLLTDQEKGGRYIASICAGPMALISHGIAKGKRVTSHPCIMNELKDAGYEYSEDRVVVDGTLITSRGPGSAVEFGLALVEALEGKDVVASVSGPMMLP